MTATITPTCSLKWISMFPDNRISDCQNPPSETVNGIELCSQHAERQRKLEDGSWMPDQKQMDADYLELRDFKALEKRLKQQEKRVGKGQTERHRQILKNIRRMHE